MSRAQKRVEPIAVSLKFKIIKNPIVTKVYLDNNVFADIEDGEYQVRDFLSIPDVEYFYSDAHIGELLEAKGNLKISQEDRLKLISNVCGQNYILSGGNEQPEFIQRNVRDMYSVVDRPIRVVINALAKDGVETFDRIRSELGFESRKLNNESYANVLRTIDKRMREKVKAIFSFLGVKTRVMSVKEMLLLF